MPYNNDPERRREYMRQYYRKRRGQLIEMLGGECVDCGTVEDLQFDHVDYTQRAFKIGERIQGKWADVLAEAQKCVLRCWPCHNVKTTAEGSVASGERHGNAKLSDAQVAEIRRRADEGSRRLADEFEVSDRHIRYLLAGAYRT